MSHDMLNKEWERGAYEMPEEEVSVMDWRQKEYGPQTLYM